MKPNAGANAGLPPFEARIWTTALLMVAIVCVTGILFDIHMGSDLRAMIPRRASVAFGFLLGWGGYHLVSRSFLDLNLLMCVVAPVMSHQRSTSISTGFLYGIVVALCVFLPVGAIDRWRHAIGVRKDDAKKKAQPYLSDHRLYDVDLDGATGSGGATGRVGRG